MIHETRVSATGSTYSVPDNRNDNLIDTTHKQKERPIK